MTASKSTHLHQTARVTFPERRQRVQTYTLLGEPFTTALTRLMFAFHVLLERLCECDTLIPKETFLPQNSHFAMCGTSFETKVY